MLISALCSYYDLLASNHQVLPEGYSNVKINYLIGLTPDGKIAEITDCQQRTTVQKGKGKPKEIISPRIMQMPKRTEKTGIESSIAEHRPMYLFGLNLTDEGFSPVDKTNKAKKSHEAFTSLQSSFLDGLHSDVLDAFRCFIEHWNPEAESENPHLLTLGKAYATSGFAFCLAGRPDLLLHEDAVLKKAWEQSLDLSKEDDVDPIVNTCAIIGKPLPIARIHFKIKNVPNGLATGNVLIGFKNPSEESYGKTQSYNSNISESAMKRYTEALNYLLADRSHYVRLSDLTVLHWAMSKEQIYDKIVQAAALVGFEEDTDEMGISETDELLKNLMADARSGALHSGQFAAMGKIDPNVDFYMVGLKPNSARLSVKFVYHKRFGELLQNIARHQADIQMSEKAKPVPLWRIQKELLIPHSKNDELDPSLGSKLLEAIVYGYRYPQMLLYDVIQRIKIDSDDEKNTYIKLNPVRAGIIKGCLNRQARLSGQEEELHMALDKTNKNPAYLCGRLFAVLEKLQLDASESELNRTIKDAYFSSACSRPAVIFPKLMRLSQYHLSKADYAKHWNHLIGEITEKLDSGFPVILPLAEQGKFILGYYHQFYSKSEKSGKADTNNDKTEE